MEGNGTGVQANGNWQGYQGEKASHGAGEFDKKQSGEGNGFGEHDPRHPGVMKAEKEKKGEAEMFESEEGKQYDNSLMKGKMNPYN